MNTLPSLQKYTRVFSVLLLTLSSSLSAYTASELLDRVKLAISLENTELEGQLRQKGVKTPLEFSSHKGVIEININHPDRPKDSYQIAITQADQQAWKLTSGGKKQRLASSQYTQKIGNTDFRLEDLTLPFLYWNKGAEIIRHVKIKGQHAQVVRVFNPTSLGSYAFLDIAILPESGSLMQVDGFNKQNKKISRLKVLSVMKKNDRYTIERLKREVINPDSGKVTNYSYLEFFPKKKRLRWKL